jgi:peptidoglycan/xylan/chitin deacetylase (PgdA/CDA1 family)
MGDMSIKHRLRDICITILHISGADFLYRKSARSRGPLTRIVVFHDVPDPTWFREMIDTLVSETHVLTPEEFICGVRKEGTVNSLVTFDDGYASWIQVALPILKEKHLSALFFINSGLLDEEEKGGDSILMKTNLLIHPRPALSWEGAHTLVASGHTIGGHARFHENLREVEAEVLRESVFGDKHALESKLGIRLTEFAYPFGTPLHIHAPAEQVVREVGYERAYTAISRFYTTRNETFMIPRMCIESGQTKMSLKKWLYGAYDLFDMMKSCVR